MKQTAITNEQKIALQYLKVREAESNLRIGSDLLPEHIKGWERGLKWEREKLSALTGESILKP